MIAGRASADDFQEVFEDLVSDGLRYPFVNGIHERQGEVVNTAALHTSYMIMLSNIRVIAGDPVAQDDLADDARPGQLFEMAIDRGETDPGHLLTGHLIDILKGGMTRMGTNDTEDQVSLPSLPHGPLKAIFSLFFIVYPPAPIVKRRESRPRRWLGKSE